MASNIMATISRRDLKDDGPTATITDVKHLASYSWIESSTPTIAVPGIPPKWCPPAVARRLPKDSVRCTSWSRNLTSALSISRNGLEAFTINVEVSGSTVIFCRTETKTKEIIAPYEFKGFGHEFEKAYTTSAISGNTGHHRIVSYRFGGLSFIVRHEHFGFFVSIHDRRVRSSYQGHPQAHWFQTGDSRTGSRRAD
ncbi:uncharacterized protein BCR38DRAFT_409274 [Pseudomassariella vexata]|uniref:Uncharacterized protein n=1 Tax=Pseudomassariella vexata TaxID=1141098 RepID=A0A1Y2DXK5_9PEZI|nr:uncharacterized protein BCR38DRAFT_409274 [Pseudomassariella vexata]ORY63856.1 hypothetical protein BCR38DRAFT_409274 [Pseudomassariella vexata]